MSSYVKFFAALLLLGSLAGCAYPGPGFGVIAADSMQDPPIYESALSD